MGISVLTNANIYTLDPKKPTATAIAIEARQNDGRILAVGDDYQVLSEFDSFGVIHNLNGKTIIPSLTDAHFHLKNYALSLEKIECEVPTKQACLDRVAAKAQKISPGEWILGHGWNQNDWGEGFGSAADLDQVAPNNPVFLTSKSLHAAWVNSTALRSAGIQDLSDQTIASGHQDPPTGILLEDQVEKVSRLIPEPTQQELIETIVKAQERLLRLGITSIHDFDQRDCFSALQQLNGDGRLVLRVTKSIPLESLDEAVGLGLRSGFGDEHLRIGSVKIFTDGALGPHTAAMLEPYEDSSENRGMLFMDAEEIFEQGHTAVLNGISLAIHAIGDRANHETLNALERLRKIENALRHRIEHVQILHPDDAGRLAELGIIASMQPIHATSDMLMADRFWGDRAAFAYGLKTQLAYGTKMAFGSDAPVESPNPFLGIHAAVTRRKLDGQPGPDGWYPAERLSLIEALTGFTSGAAYAAGLDDHQGRLAPGFLADLVVLDTDIFRCDADQIAHIKPIAAMVSGNWIFGSDLVQ
jgi:predicted amidohydrolase YtcJ